MIVDYIATYKDRFGVEPIVEVLNEHGITIALSTYYEHAAREFGPTTAELEDAYAANEVHRLWTTNRRLYGQHKLWKTACRAGGVTGRERGPDQVARLMRIAGIRGVVRGKRSTITTRPEPAAPRHPDHIQRAWDTPARPDQWWVADFSYVWTLAGFIYVSFVTDVYSRRILGWRVTTSKTTPLVLSALEQAIFTRRRGSADHGFEFTTTGLVHHSDAGSQGGFNRSSQHLDYKEVFDGSSTTGCRSCRKASDEIAWSPVSAAACGAGVLAPDRRRDGQRGRRGRCRRVSPGRVAVVPQRWRHATDQSRRAVGPVPVAC